MDVKAIVMEGVESLPHQVPVMGAGLVVGSQELCQICLAFRMGLYFPTFPIVLDFFLCSFYIVMFYEMNSNSLSNSKDFPPLFSPFYMDLIPFHVLCGLFNWG